MRNSKLNEIPLYTYWTVKIQNCNYIFKILIKTILNASGDMEQQKPIHCLWEYKMVTATLEDSVTVSCIIKYSLTMSFGNYTPKYLPRWAETLCLHENLHIKVYSSFIYNCQKLAVTKMFFEKWMVKELWQYSWNEL